MFGLKEKKICFVCPWMNEDGGLQRVVTNLINMFSANNSVTLCVLSKIEEPPYYTLEPSVQVVYITNAADSNRQGSAKLLGKLFEYVNCPSVELVKKVYYPERRVNELQLHIQNEAYDYVIASCGDLSILLSLINRSKTRAYLIGWQHNSFDIYFKDSGKYYFSRDKLAQLSYRNLDKLICLTKKDAKRYRDELGITGKCIYNPLSFRCEKKADLHQKNIVFVGRLSWEQKGLEYLVQIIDIFCADRRSEDWTITIVGGGNDESRLINAFARKNYRERVKSVGQTRDVVPYYTQASVCINTSKWEGFGLVITEAMECGLPVVAFNTDGPSEIIRDGENGFVIPCYDVQAFASKLLLLAQDTDMRCRMGTEAIKTAECFSAEKVFIQWEETLQEL